MSEKLYSSPLLCLGTQLTASIDGESHVLDTQGWQKAVTAAREGADVTLQNVPTFRLGWNRNHVSPDAASLQTFADVRDAAHLLSHDQSQIMGRVVSGRVEQGTLFQDLEVNTDLGRSILATGARLKHSIAWYDTEQTQHLCSACGLEMFGNTECSHWPGQKLDSGDTVQLMYTNAEFVETSGTFSPAVPGLSVTAEMAGLDQLVFEKRLALTAGPTIIDMGRGRVMDDETTTTEETSAVEPDSLTADPAPDPQLTAQIAELQETLARERGERELEAATAMTADLRESGRLIGDPDKITAKLVAYPGGSKAFLEAWGDHLPPSVAHSTQQLSGGGGSLPPQPPQPGDYAALTLAAKERAARDNISYQEAHGIEYRAMLATQERR